MNKNLFQSYAQAYLIQGVFERQFDKWKAEGVKENNQTKNCMRIFVCACKSYQSVKKAIYALMFRS